MTQCLRGQRLSAVRIAHTLAIGHSTVQRVQRAGARQWTNVPCDAVRVAIPANTCARSRGTFQQDPHSQPRIAAFFEGMGIAFQGPMTTINSFRDLTVWQASMDLADVCFDIVDAIPHPYRFVFANQLLPAGISIPSNIAEGSRRPTKAYLNHISFSLGSHGEVDTLFELIHRRKLVPEPLLNKGIVLVEPIGKMLHGLVESLEMRLNADKL
jgi:four helix bundle protein